MATVVFFEPVDVTFDRSVVDVTFVTLTLPVPKRVWPLATEPDIETVTPSAIDGGLSRKFPVNVRLSTNFADISSISLSI